MAYRTNEDLVHALANLFDEIELETPEEVDEALREAGFDPDEIGARMKSAAEQVIANSPFNQLAQKVDKTLVLTQENSKNTDKVG